MSAESKRRFTLPAATFIASPLLALGVCFYCCGSAQPAKAGVTWSGDIDPADPIDWNSATRGYIGMSGMGTLEITDDSDVVDGNAYIGYLTGSSGTVLVDGSGSTWVNETGLYVGWNGDAALDITGGAQVSGQIAKIAYDSGTTGRVTVDGTGSRWINSNDLYVATHGNCTLNISDGGVVSNRHGYLCYLPASTAVVTVDGSGSTWANDGSLYVGRYGDATLNITSGGTVTVRAETWADLGDNASSSIKFDNGTLTTGGFLCDLDNLTGTGTINTNGMVSEIDLVFDATHGLKQTFHINRNSSQSITINLDLDLPATFSMGAGYSGAGTMRISDGVDITSYHGFIGYNAEASGEVTVDGAGSTWSNRWDLHVGTLGNGTLNISRGGKVSNTKDGQIGWYFTSTGKVTVDGIGSTWTNGSDLFVAKYGKAQLDITGGGLVSVAGQLSIDSDEEQDGVINMSMGGKLALFGNAEASLEAFLGLIEGTDAIRYWDDSVSDWANINDATFGQDYTLRYVDGGDLEGYTVLTVGAVPEPSALACVLGLLPAGILASARRSRRRVSVRHTVS